MLKIQRASAGSGKTYALARNFILNLIAYKKEDGTWVLRNRRQIEDALQHILAITFTNKATNEMKMRIIGNLSLLSEASENDLSEDEIKQIPYLKEFQEITGESYSRIGESASHALKVILNNYSIFKISTIDSFFQEILRTFTYEANLNDSYQLEIDSTFVTESAMDSAINELDRNPRSMGAAAFWLKKIMREEAKKSQRWNPFSKKGSGSSVYAQIRKALLQLEKEDFKDIKNELDEFFEREDSSEILMNIYETLKEKAETERHNLLAAIQHARKEVENHIEVNNIPSGHLYANFLKQLPKIAAFDPGKTPSSMSYSSFQNGSVFKSNYFKEENELDALVKEMYDKVDEWLNPSPFSYYKNWKIYGTLLPYLGVLMEVRTFLSDVLEVNNLLQLSDTGYILKKIIGEEDAPFVYERLGSRIDHYLIDEFQDTSRMQWDVLQPLINEGLAKNKDSLIIGDPKQSIYRFRNADHKLITEVVPSIYSRYLTPDYLKEDNTNWRSHTNIVKFNNLLFKTLANTITEKSDDKGGKTNFNNLYQNVVQYPNNQKGMGYVEIKRLGGSSNDLEASEEKTGNETDKESFETLALNELGPLVSELMERGYRQKDICILVNTNSHGKEVVQALIDYNETLSDNQTKIDFMSEESLLVSSSPAVSIIIEVLEKMSNPVSPKKEEETEPGKLRYYKWKDLKFDYIMFSKNNPSLSPVEKILGFLGREQSEDLLSNLINDLQIPSLVSITESIIGIFLDEKMRRSEAIYLASFMDLMNEFSQNHPLDIASFLEWWYSRGSNMSISSPEDMDAVEIMTIHKSKGLEFKCVIVPFANDSFYAGPFKEEWRWVRPVKLEGIEFPPILPIKTSSNLEGSVHEKIYREYYDQVLTDVLNRYYVAFTRAKNELYIFIPHTERNSFSINDLLFKFLKGELSEPEISGNEEINLADKKAVVNSDDMIFSLGRKFTQKEIEEEIRKEVEKESAESPTMQRIFNDFYVNCNTPRLRSTVSLLSPSGE